ncbi:MAG: hypothetical protein ABIE14_00860, partial [Patescibacteria group bacterium]
RGRGREALGAQQGDVVLVEQAALLEHGAEALLFDEEHRPIAVARTIGVVPVRRCSFPAGLLPFPAKVRANIGSTQRQHLPLVGFPEMAAGVVEDRPVNRDVRVVGDERRHEFLDEVRVLQLRARQLLDERASLVENLAREGEIETAKAELKKPSNIIAKTNGEILFQFPRSLTRKSGETNTIAKNKILAVENLKADILKIEQSSAKEKENNFERSSASKKEFSFLSTRSIAILGGMLGIAVAIFIVWLIRHEQRLLAATSQRFQQLDFRPNFKLSSRVKKLFQQDKKSSSHEENTIK